MKNNRVDVVYDFLKKKGELIEFMDLYKELAKIDKRFVLDDFMLVSQLYTDIIIDGRFIILREEVGEGKNKKEVHKCGIRDNYTYDEIKESISRFGDVILDTDEEIENSQEKISISSIGVNDGLENEKVVEEIDDAPSKDIDDGNED